MSQCQGCGTDSEEAMCAYCELLVHEITGRTGAQIQRPDAIASLREELGDPDPVAPKIWRRISMVSAHDPSLWWALDPEEMEPESWITERPEPWLLSDEDIAMISLYGKTPFSILRQDLPPEERRVFDLRIRMLARGGTLPDGTHLSWNSGTFHVDGVPLRVPYRSLNKILKNGSRFMDIDWKRLLAAIDLAVRKTGSDPYMNPGSSNFATVHPIAYILAPTSDQERERNIFERMARGMRIRPPENRDFLSLFANASWMERWHACSTTNQVVGLGARMRQEPQLVPMTLMIKNGRLQVRVRRNSGWRRLEVGSDPMVWAKLLTWALSPPDHPDYARLMCLTQNLFTDQATKPFSEEDTRGILFLRGIVESNERAHLLDSGKAIVVTGTSGLAYHVSPGGGSHGTRFLVTPMHGSSDESYHRQHMRMRRARRDFICIVERPELRRLVLGDAMGSIVLSLLDDVNSSRHIDTLRRHLEENKGVSRRTHQANPEVREMQEALELRQRLANNRVDRRVTRATREFPMLWGVFLRLPLGERMMLTPMGRGPNVRFDDCGTTFATANLTERQVIYSMLESSGWIRDTEEERVRGTQRIYIRTGTGDRDLGPAVEAFCRMLEHRLILDERNRAIPEPLWHHFERRNPGICALLPGSDDHIGD